MKHLNKSALRRATSNILKLRINRRRAALDCLKPLIPHAQDVAGLFTEAEMRVLLATHDRIAWRELTTIDPTFQSSPNDDPDRLMYGTSLYSVALLGHGRKACVALSLAPLTLFQGLDSTGLPKLKAFLERRLPVP